MSIHIINSAQARQLLSMKDCIDVMEDALISLEKGTAYAPLRTIMSLPGDRGVLGMMPSYIEKAQVMGLKMISVYPGNEQTEFESHQGGVMLFELKNGRPIALVDASAITEVRTAAVSAIATKLLASENAHDLAILGSGTQARAHLEAMRLVRPISRVRVWSLPLDHARQFAERESGQKGVRIELMDTAEAAVKGADIICTTTAAMEPILFGKWIASGAHINAVGSCKPAARELDSEAVVRSHMFVDNRESAVNEAGDFLFPRQEGLIDDDHILGELGEILTGKAKGRKDEYEKTLFKSLGLAVEDLAAAHFIYRNALLQGIGISVEFEGSRMGFS